MRGYVPLLLLLAAIWGSSFMFIKIAVDELEPTTTMAARLVFAAIPLVGLLILRHGWSKAWRDMGKITKPAIINPMYGPMVSGSTEASGSSMRA